MEIDSLIREIEATADPATTARVRKLVEEILKFHGEAVERMLELAPESLAPFAHDPAVAALLLLYGLHPEEFATRVRRAVDSLPRVELAGISGFQVRLRTRSRGMSREAIEQALYAAAPEIEAIEVESYDSPTSTFIPVEALLRA
jgi:hypothetical protein